MKACLREDLFAGLAEFDLSRKELKRQGVNDFNLLSSVLSVNDEVRLHTRFLYALLNPKSRHYRGTRFLELFLAAIGRENWLNLESVEVKKEYCPSQQSERIDLFITDGSRQIVIENKLNAQDQKRQVERYLRAIGSTCGERAADTLFIYLTKDRMAPSAYALGALSVFEWDGQLAVGLRKDSTEKQPWAFYQNLSYRHGAGSGSIHTWLKACEKEAGSSPNVLWAIRDYQAAVERSTREYQSKVKTMKEFLEERIAENASNHALAIELAEALPILHADILDVAMTVKLDELFEAATKAGVLQRIGIENANILLKDFVAQQHQGQSEKFVYQRENNFFSKEGNKDCGALFLVKEGDFADKVVLMLFYGKSMLHVGYVCDPDVDQERLLSVCNPRLNAYKGLRGSAFPNAWTYAEKLKNEGIMHLAKFESSPQRLILEQLLGVVWPDATDMASKMGR